jgi:hypothetical protein
MELFRLTKGQISAIEFLNSCVRSGATWKMNHKTGLVDVSGDFNCSKRGLTDFKGIRFGKVDGYFDCSSNELTSLEGAPQKVENNFNCSRNQIESLVGSPLVLWGNFDCSYNKLTTLEGVQKDFESMNFDCSYNQIETLVGGPEIGGWIFDCKGNKLKDLEGAPVKFKTWSGSEPEINYYANKGSVPGKVLKLIHYTMIKHNIPYIIALGMVKNQIDKNVLKKMKVELELSEDFLKGASMMGRFLNN